MNRDRLLDRTRWAGNVAARAIGQLSVVHRPHDAWNPLDPAGAYLRLPVAFASVAGKFDRAHGYDDTMCTGFYDASYTRAGDYLVVGDRIWFIASQEPFFPNLCVETNRLVSFARVVSPTTNGANAYTGVTAATSMAITGPWPASIIERTGSGAGAAGLPTDTPAAYWTVLLPPIPSVTLMASDQMIDNAGRNGVVVSAEASRLGWRLIVKATTV